MIQWMLAIWSLVLLPSLNPALNIWKFMVHVRLKPGLENFEPGPTCLQFVNSQTSALMESNEGNVSFITLFSIHPYKWCLKVRKGFPGGSAVKNPPAKQETWVQFLGWQDPLEKEMATHSSILAWRIPWTEECGRQPLMGSQRIRHNLAIKQQQQQSLRK